MVYVLHDFAKLLILFGMKWGSYMIATIVNSVVIIIGGLIGSIFGDKIGERYTKPLMAAMAFVVAIIGIQGAVETSNILIVVVCIVIGTIIGSALKLDDRISSSGDKIKAKLSGTKICRGRFSDAFVTSSLLFCIGTMAILGSIQAGLNHDYSILFTKSIIDGVSAVAFSAALGPGVILSAVPIFIIQGSITLLAGVAQPFLTTEVITEMSAVGGPIFLGMSVNMLELRKERIKIGDMVPSIIIPIIYFPVVNFFSNIF